MSDDAFDADWLTLREPVDHRSRATGIDEALTRWWSAVDDRTRILDLGCGTGSNLRYLSPRLGRAAPGRVQRWTLVDHDLALLERVRLPGAGTSAGGRRPTRSTSLEVRSAEPTPLDLTTVHGDLAREGLSLIDGSHLVTASALLDIVSGAWVDELARRCANARTAVLFALTYDGSMTWDAPDRDDAFVRDTVNAHQRREKGLGGALGPDATRHAERAFAARGYRTRTAPAPWRLGPGDDALARALLDGWRTAAIEQRPDARPRIEAWAGRRTTTIEAGAFELTVGHLDLLALPPGNATDGGDTVGDPTVGYGAA